MDQRKPESLSRREFLKGCGATALVTAHSSFAGAAVANGDADPSSGPRILELELQTAARLSKMKEFYHGLLGLKVIEDSVDRVTFAAGATKLTFVPSSDGKPFYHFAFNIPEKKIVRALEWQKARTPIIPVPEGLHDPAYPDEVVNYGHWNAHSVFFFDPAENVVEYIARHDLKDPRDGRFGSADILYASEIAFVVDDVPAAAAQLGASVGTGIYKRGSEVFTALGDERGLLLVMKRGRVLSFASPKIKEAGVYRTKAVVRGRDDEGYRFSGFPYEVEMVPRFGLEPKTN